MNYTYWRLAAPATAVMQIKSATLPASLPAGIWGMKEKLLLRVPVSCARMNQVQPSRGLWMRASSISSSIHDRFFLTYRRGTYRTSLAAERTLIHSLVGFFFVVGKFHPLIDFAILEQFFCAPNVRWPLI